MDYRIRSAERGDLDSLAGVERESKNEIGLEYFSAELENPVCRIYLAEVIPDGPAAAYLLAWILDEEDLELHHLAVLPGHRRRGLGRLLFDHFLKAHHGKLKRVFLEVRESNSGAIAFYTALGCQCTGRRKGYYRDPYEDAVLFQYSISTER